MPRPDELACRPSQLIGFWSIEPTAFDSLQQQALAALSEGKLEMLQEQSRELADEAQQNPYQTDQNGVAHFDVHGPITKYPTSMQSLFGGTSTVMLQRALDKAARDPDVKGAILHIDSPGGLSSAGADAAAAIQKFGSTKPVSAHISGMGTSLAYRLAVATDHISIDPAGVTGSVGTVMQLSDTSEVFKRAGVKRHYVTTGDRKSTGAPGTVITDEQLADMKTLAMGVNQGFRDAVKSRRKISDANMKDVLRAGVYAAHQAKEIGLVDSVTDTASAIENFTQSLSTGGHRTLPDVTDTGASPQRSVMLTSEQLAQAKALPGCGDISAENADGKLLAAALSLQSNLTQTSSKNDTLLQRVSTLEQEIGASKTIISTPVLKAMASASRIVLKSGIDKQAFSPAVGEALASVLIGKDESLSAVGLTPNATGDCLAAQVFTALASNGAAPNVGKEPGGQPAPKTAAGAPEGEAVSPDRIKQLMSMTPLGESAMAAK